jgi:hypothetical protein
MKSIKNTIAIASMAVLSAFLPAGQSAVVAQTFNETLSETASFANTSDDNLLVVNNISGFIEVEGYNGSEVQITAEKTIKAKNQRILEQGKSEVSMKVAQKDGVIYVYVETPNSTFNIDTGRFNHSGQWQEVRYSYLYNIKIKVPKNTSIDLRAINRGGIVVRNIEAKELSANNINGPITFEDVAGQTFVNALNKDISIRYTKNPTAASVYKSLNGDINLTMQNGLNADVKFKTLNGDIYTNLETTVMPSATKMKSSKGKHGTKYKMNSNSEFMIGNGGVELDFDLLNGSVTIKG